MSLYDELATTAKDLIKEFGAPLSYSSISFGAYSPVTGSASKTVSVTTEDAVILDFPAKDIDGQAILQSDRKVLLHAKSGLVPKVGDTVLAFGENKTVIAVKPIRPAGTPVLYTLHVR